MADFSLIMKAAADQVNQINENCNQFANQDFTIDIGKPGGEQKLEEAQEKIATFNNGVERQMKGLKNKIVGNLNKTYNQATESMEPYKSLVDLISGIAAPSADPSALLKTVTGILDVLNKLKEHYQQQYLGPVNTIIGITTAASTLTNVMGLLNGLPSPKINVVKTETTFKKTEDPNTGEPIITEVTETKPVETITPTPPTAPSISLGDITSGTQIDEKPDAEPAKPQRRWMFGSYSALSNSDKTYLKQGTYSICIYTENEARSSLGPNRYTKKFNYDTSSKTWKITNDDERTYGTFGSTAAIESKYKESLVEGDIFFFKSGASNIYAEPDTIMYVDQAIDETPTLIDELPEPSDELIGKRYMLVDGTCYECQEEGQNVAWVKIELNKNIGWKSIAIHGSSDEELEEYSQPLGGFYRDVE